MGLSRCYTILWSVLLLICICNAAILVNKGTTDRTASKPDTSNTKERKVPVKETEKIAPLSKPNVNSQLDGGQGGRTMSTWPQVPIIPRPVYLPRRIDTDTSKFIQQAHQRINLQMDGSQDAKPAKSLQPVTAEQGPKDQGNKIDTDTYNYIQKAHQRMSPPHDNSQDVKRSQEVTGNQGALNLRYTVDILAEQYIQEGHQRTHPQVDGSQDGNTVKQITIQQGPVYRRNTNGTVSYNYIQAALKMMKSQLDGCPDGTTLRRWQQVSSPQVSWPNTIATATENNIQEAFKMNHGSRTGFSSHSRTTTSNGGHNQFNAYDEFNREIYDTQNCLPRLLGRSKQG